MVAVAVRFLVPALPVAVTVDIVPQSGVTSKLAMLAPLNNGVPVSDSDSVALAATVDDKVKAAVNSTTAPAALAVIACLTLSGDIARKADSVPVSISACDAAVKSPVLVPDKLATAALASMALLIAPLAMAVALPTDVTGPVRLALVVTVAALPVVF